MIVELPINSKKFVLHILNWPKIAASIETLDDTSVASAGLKY
jgi:hypothetical protein